MRNLNWITIVKLGCIISFGLLLTACSGSDDSDSTAGTGSITLGITDTPVDMADKVVIQFTGVEIIAADGEGGDTGGTGGESGATTQTITFTEPKTIDLLALQGGLRELLLDGQEMPAGEYGQIRLMVQAEHDTVFDSYIEILSAQHELRVPSGSQSGLKLIHNFDLATDGSTDFTIDFDLRKSVVLAGGDYMLKPVLRLVETESASSITGIIDPAVFTGQTCSADPLTGYAVYVYPAAATTTDDLGSASEPVTTAGVALDENSMYAYTVGFLEPGDYKVAATCTADADNPEADDDIVLVGEATVTVAAGATTTHNFQ